MKSAWGPMERIRFNFCQMFLVLCVVFGAGSAVLGDSKLYVVATIQTLASLAAEVGGDKVSAISLSKGYMDPHFVEGKPSLVLDLHKADLLIEVGLELEIGWLPPLVLGARNSKIQAGTDGRLDASESIK